MRTLVIIRDCHAKHNLVWRDCTTEDEKWIRKYAQKRGWKVCVRKENENNDYVLSRYLRKKLIEKERKVNILEEENKQLKRYCKLWANEGEKLLEKIEGGAL